MRLTKSDIQKLEVLYQKLENEDGIEHDELTPNLEAYQNWLYKNQRIIEAYAQTKFAGWGGNALSFAIGYVEELEKAPKLSHSKNVDENDFALAIIDSVFSGGEIL